MQMQLYLFGAVSASFLYVVEANTTGVTSQISGNYEFMILCDI